MQDIPSITRRIVYKIITDNHFCTKTENLFFDLMGYVFSCIFYWIQMGDIFLLYYKFKVKEKVKVYDIYLNVFIGNK